MPVSEPEPLLVKGAVVRGYLDLLRQDGVRDIVLRRMPEASRTQIDPPPLFSTWIDAQPVQDLISALAAERGYETCRMLGVRALDGPLCNILVPIARAFLHYSALGPTAVFSNLERVASIAVKPVKICFKSTGPSAGTVTFSFPRPYPLASAHVWRGAISHAYLLCGTEGVIGVPSIHGNDVSYAARWSL